MINSSRVERDSGTWDKGAAQITLFLAEHECNSVCRDMGFTRCRDSPTKGTTVEQPLRIGFDHSSMSGTTP
jgi:hypothetical protein